MNMFVPGANVRMQQGGIGGKGGGGGLFGGLGGILGIGAVPVFAGGGRRGLRFPRLGPHSFRRANITWRQEVGGSSIEASKIAGHSTVRMTEEYTKIQLTRQEELTRLIQERLANVAKAKEEQDPDGSIPPAPCPPLAELSEGAATQTIQ